jgi:hypothetical protein
LHLCHDGGHLGDFALRKFLPVDHLYLLALSVLGSGFAGVGSMLTVRGVFTMAMEVFVDGVSGLKTLSDSVLASYFMGLVMGVVVGVVNHFVDHLLSLSSTMLVSKLFLE